MLCGVVAFDAPRCTTSSPFFLRSSVDSARHPMMASLLALLAEERVIRGPAATRWQPDSPTCS